MIRIIYLGKKENNEVEIELPKLKEGEQIALIDFHNGTVETAIRLYKSARDKNMICATNQGSYNIFLEKLTGDKKKEWEEENGELYILPDIF